MGETVAVVPGIDSGGRESAIRRLVDIPTLSELLGVSDRHVRRLVFEDRIPYFKVGRFVRFDPVEINEWLTATRPSQWRRGVS